MSKKEAYRSALLLLYNTAIHHFVKSRNYIAFGNDQNDFLMLDNAELSIFIGDKAVYGKANYYCHSPKDVLNFLKEHFNVG